MSEKIEQVKKLEVEIKRMQDEMFMEEHGVTQEQARKLNEFIFYEPTGKEFDFWSGMEVKAPSVSILIDRLEKKNESLNKKLSELEWEHKKLWIGSNFFGWGMTALLVILIVAYFKG